MNTSLLLGNGINRCILSEISWGNLLDAIAREYDVKLNQDVSFPMQFECLVNQILKERDIPSDSIYSEIKAKISAPLINARLPMSAPHTAFSTRADCLLTTNYDFLLEQSMDVGLDVSSFPSYPGQNINKYNLRNSYKVGGKEVFHIHGDILRTQSICLGYEHYAGTLQNLRGEVARKKKIGQEEKPNIILLLEGMVKSSLSDSSDRTVWAEKFFTDNIHIVGLGLSESEIDLWWLITYRAYLYYSDRFGAKSLIHNRIVYHDIGIESDKKMRYMLTNNAVEYRFHRINSLNNENFFREYERIAQSIF